MITLSIITGSTRPHRFNIQPARWIEHIARQRTESTVNFFDLADMNLPFLDEAIPASQHQYAQEHTKAWSEKIAVSDAFLWVTPEYNHSFSPVLKNAIDYLFSEWNYKPVGFVSYGSLAGGARAVEHLRGVAGELKMYDLREQILLPNYWEHVNEKGEYQFSERHVQSANGLLDALIFWARIMKDARAELAASR